MTGKAKYRLVDEKVRYFVAPSIEDIEASPVSPLHFGTARFVTLSVPSYDRM